MCTFCTRRIASSSQHCGHPFAHLLVPAAILPIVHTPLLIWLKSSAFFKIPCLHGISALQNLSPSIPIASRGGPTSWLLSHSVILLLGQEPLLAVLWWTPFPTCQSSTESMFHGTGNAWWLWHWCVKDIDLFFHHVVFPLFVAPYLKNSHGHPPTLFQIVWVELSPNIRGNHTFLTIMTRSEKSSWPKWDPILQVLGLWGKLMESTLQSEHERIRGAGAKNEADLVEGRAGNQEKLVPW